MIAVSRSEGVDFFESKVRPVLVEHCFECHSAGAKAVKGGLRLDSLDAMKKGGDNGPAVVPGDVDASLLAQAVRYTDEQMQMPPKGKLPDATIAALEGWIRRGAAMPHGVEPKAAGASSLKRPPGLDFEAARSHWSYQPIRTPAVPEVAHKEWPRSPVDRFILARLEAAGLTPSPPADRRTLLRRVTFDLIGLPPTAAEIEAFANDRDPAAYERVVDRLLASPHYGERWGRHWLDVARYANTKDGVLMFGDDRVRPYSYTYRDYVIRAFNEDLGFDQFVQDQLAADVLAPRDRPWRLAAMGLLTVGKGFDNNIHDQIDDRIDVVSRGFLGLTVACAVPRPQVRRDPHGRLLLAVRHLRQLRGAARAAADRSRRGGTPAERIREASRGQAERDPAIPREPVSAPLRDDPTPDARLPGPGRHDRARPARDGDLLLLAGPRGPAAPDCRTLATLPPRSVPPRRSRLRPLA